VIEIFAHQQMHQLTGVARPRRAEGALFARRVGIGGAGAWVIASHELQANFGRTCLMTEKRPGT
jgi:hypothetical protein